MKSLPERWILSPVVMDGKKRSTLHILLSSVGYEVSKDVSNISDLRHEFRTQIWGNGVLVSCAWEHRTITDYDHRECRTREKIEYNELVERAKYMIKHNLKPPKVVKI